MLEEVLEAKPWPFHTENESFVLDFSTPCTSQSLPLLPSHSLGHKFSSVVWFFFSEYQQFTALDFAGNSDYIRLSVSCNVEVVYDVGRHSNECIRKVITGQVKLCLWYSAFFFPLPELRGKTSTTHSVVCLMIPPSSPVWFPLFWPSTTSRSNWKNWLTVVCLCVTKDQHLAKGRRRSLTFNICNSFSPRWICACTSRSPKDFSWFSRNASFVLRFAYSRKL